MIDPGADVAALRAARDRVLAEIARASAQVGRDPATVTLVAVSKTVPVERIRNALQAGFDLLGENRVQEAVAKAAELPDARWHLVGPLQSNKARRAVETFEVIETVDSLALAERLDRLAAEMRPGRQLPVLVQVNVDEDRAKAGIRPHEMDDALSAIGAFSGLEVRGLMTIGRLAATPDEARATFRGLRELSERLTTEHAWLGPELSMGMTDDYPIAVEEGATIVRVGRAIFGERPHHGESGGA
ncbi:MAG: YggS family pyridoxal phosphate-dependent enzyme [Chloroflexota bacterium]